MMEIRTSRFIAAPINITFDVFSDVTKIEERIDGIQKVELLSDTQSGVGTRWRETRVMFGREATEEMEISVYNPNRSYEVVASSHGMDYHTIYTFTEKNGGTEVEMIFSGKANSLMAKLMQPLGFLFMGSLKAALKADMDNLQTICEQRAKM